MKQRSAPPSTMAASVAMIGDASGCGNYTADICSMTA